MNDRLRVVLVFLGIVLAALLLTSTSLTSGFSTDDYFFLLSFQGFPGLPEYTQNPLNTFVFSDGDAARNLALTNRGLVPWWADPDAKLAFWRPLASLSHWLDYTLWGMQARFMHLHSMLWYALAGGLAFLLYRRVHRETLVAGIAALILVMNENNGSAVGWLSSRNLLMATAFGVLALIAHHAWRHGKWKPGAALGPIFLLCGLLCGEAAAGVGGYLLAYALFVDDDAWGRRIVSLTPYVLVGALWLAVYQFMGFGATSSAWYINPIRDPWAFAQAASYRLPSLLFNEFFAWPQTFIRLAPDYPGAAFAVLMAILAGLFAVLIPLLKSQPIARFWLAGSVVSLIPMCAVVQQPRLLLIGEIGSAAVLALFIVGIRKSYPWTLKQPWWRIPASVYVYLMIAIHLVLPLYLLPVGSELESIRAAKLERGYDQIPDGPELAGQTVAILQAPTDFTSWYFMVTRAAQHRALPNRLRVLSVEAKDVEVLHPEEAVLELRAPGSLTGSSGRSLYRNPADLFDRGETVRLDGMDTTVLEVDEEGWPVHVQYRFDKSLDDPSFVWLTTANVPREIRPGRYVSQESYVRVTLPPVGGRANLGDLVNESPDYPSTKSGAAPSGESRSQADSS